MSENYREQHPLLCDDLSEEEHFGPDYPRRYRPLLYRGRARNQAKGAVNIITRWPDHLASFLSYWWIGLSMIGITVFIIYNSVIAFALLPPSHLKPSRPRTANKVQISSGTSSLPNVYMHIIINPNDEINLNKYLPYIEQFSNKYVDFKYNLVVIRNDTSRESTLLSAEENNDIAFNSLWDGENNKKVVKEIKNSNVHIRHVVLSHYMDKSPLSKDWRHLPDHFIEFIIRAISIWDKGGVAFNPDVLTSKAPNIIFDKLHNIFQNYGKPRDNKSNEDIMKGIFDNHKEKNKKKVNNIRDIIEILEHDDDNSLNSSKDGLMEAENRNSILKRSGRKLLSTTHDNFETKIELSNFALPHVNKHFLKNNNDIENREDKKNPKIELNAHAPLQSSFVDIFDLKEAAPQVLGNKTKLSLLPLFLEFLFHDKTKLNLPKIKTEEVGVTNVTRQRKSVIPFDILKTNSSAMSDNSSNQIDSTVSDEYPPMIISAKSIELDSDNKINEVSKYEKDILTIDLKGNIIATETPCHAFIGTIFSNVVHHSADETLKDFIIAELSYFCKGLLSSCRSLDVILL